MTNFKFPISIHGRDGKADYDRIMAGEDVPVVQPVASPIILPNNILKSDYIQIPNEKFVIAIAETNFNLNYENAHKTTLKQGLEIPMPHNFMKFHNHIIDCYKNKKPIFDAGGNNLPDKIKDDLYTQLTSKCWTWLNGKFNISENQKTIEYITRLDANDNFVVKTEKLEDCLMKNCYVNFKKLTKQGLASVNSEHSTQNFSKGENIYFYFPVNGQVARFIAVSGRADLYCNRGPADTDSDLGVRAAKQEEIK